MTLRTILRAEWTRMVALRSTRWSLLAFVVVTIGLGALIASATGHLATDDPATLDPAGTALSGFALSQVAVAVFGVLTISSEYGSGSIRTTFAAMPRRSRVLAVKAAVVALPCLVLGGLASLVTLLVAGAIDAGAHQPGISLADGSVLRTVLGGGLLAASCALFGFALGALVRSSAGGVVAAVGGVLVAPIVSGVLPGPVGRAIGRYVTSNAGSQILGTVRGANALSPWAGIGVFCLWWAAVLALAFVLLERRDA